MIPSDKIWKHFLQMTIFTSTVTCVANDVPSKFDILTAEDMSDVFSVSQLLVQEQRMRRCLRSGSHHMCMRTLSVTLHFYFCTGRCSKTGPSRFRTSRCLIALSRRAPVSSGSESSVPIVQRRRVRKTQNLVTQMEIKLAKAMREVRTAIYEYLISSSCVRPSHNIPALFP
jgi:hypothetical protein